MTGRKHFAEFSVGLIPVAALIFMAAFLFAAFGEEPDPAAKAAQEPNPLHKVQLDSTGTISGGTLEDEYGIEILRIAVTAQGGLVDFRFKILDPDRARVLIKAPIKPPTLVAADSGLSLNSPQKIVGSVRLQKDAVCFLLYPNVRTAVKAGTLVSAVFGGVRVEPVKAQ